MDYIKDVVIVENPEDHTGVLCEEGRVEGAINKERRSLFQLIQRGLQVQD